MSKALKAKELRGTAPAELRETLTKLQEELFKSRLRKSTNQLENVMLIRNARRDIARVNTILAEGLRSQAAEGQAAQARAGQASQTSRTSPASKEK
jgi:large subunit ribosomal protein L29